MKLIKFLSIVASLIIDAVTILVYIHAFPVVSDNFTLSCIRLATCIGLPIGTILLPKYIVEEDRVNYSDGDYTSVTRNRYFFLLLYIR